MAAADPPLIQPGIGMSLNNILQLHPEYRDYVWGGDRLRPGVFPTAEAWVIYANDKMSNDSLAGLSLQDLSRIHGVELLGKRVVERTGDRFPLLIKLLDCAEWLSLQVHPSDEKAVSLHGSGQFGKTEAWHILDAAPGARLIAGLITNTPREDMETAIRNGTILDFARYLDVQTGDTIFMPAGTIHALGPGLLIYEVQQTSDLTYRVYDWGRPQSERRLLHIAESIAAANPASQPVLYTLPPLYDGSQQVLASCRYFTLKMLSARFASIDMNTMGETFHALTVIEGSAQVQAEAEIVTLGQFQSALIPAATGAYQIHPNQNFCMLMASVEE